MTFSDPETVSMVALIIFSMSAAILVFWLIIDDGPATNLKKVLATALIVTAISSAVTWAVFTDVQQRKDVAEDARSFSEICEERDGVVVRLDGTHRYCLRKDLFVDTTVTE